MPFTFRLDKNLSPRIQESDPVLRPFLLANSNRKSDAEFQTLLSRAETLLNRRIKRYLSGPSESEDIEDARGEARHHITRALMRLRDKSDSPPIRSFDALVRHIVRNACWKTIETRHPERQALKQEILEILKSGKEITVWKGPDGGLVSGLPIWQSNQPNALDYAKKLQSLRDDPNDFLLENNVDAYSVDEGLSTLLTAIARYLGAPTPVSILVTVVANIAGVDDTPTSIDDPEESRLPSSDRDHTHDEAVYRLSLGLLWKTILELSPTQRTAILLHFNYFDHGLERFLEYGVASMRDLARAVDMGHEEFVAIWNDLPLMNQLIALHLTRMRGAPVTERNVIQFRDDGKSALVKRLIKAGWWHEDEIRQRRKEIFA